MGSLMRRARSAVAHARAVPHRAAARTAPVRRAAHVQATQAAPEADILQHMQLLLNSREILEDTAIVEVLPIAGVTFEGRQEALGRLQLRQAVLAVREPWNAYDPSAVRIETVSGEQLGYVPRRATGLFTLEVCSGHIESVGRSSDTQPLGARVRLFPSLPTVTLDLLPRSWADKANLAKALGPALWQELSSRVLERAKGYCSATSARAGPSLPLAPLPTLRFDPAARLVSAVGLKAVAAPLAAAARIDREPDGRRRAAALRLLCSVNGWSQSDLEGYLRRVQARRDQIEREQWAFDASPLKALR